MNKSIREWKNKNEIKELKKIIENRKYKRIKE